MTQLKLFSEKELNELIPYKSFKEKVSYNDIRDINTPSSAKEAGSDVHDLIRIHCENRFGEKSKLHYALKRSIKEFSGQDLQIQDLGNYEVLIMYKSLERIIKDTGVKKQILRKWAKANSITHFGEKQYDLLKSYFKWIVKLGEESKEY